MGRLAAAVSVALMAILLLAVSAQAAITHLPNGSFNVFNPGRIGVDEEIGAVYVVAGAFSGKPELDALEKFHEDGSPWNFSATGTNSIELQSAEFQTVAVDNSGGVNEGTIYLGSGQVFSRSGVFIATTGRSSTELNFPTEEQYPPCGTAVDSNGNFYVAHTRFRFGGSLIDKYHPTGAWLLGQEPQQEWPIAATMGGPENEPGLGTIENCELGVDSGGAVYVRHGFFGGSGEVRRFAPSAFGLDNPQFRLVDPSATALSVDQKSNDVYIDERHGESIRVRRYDENGTPVETFGEGAIGNSSLGVGVDGSTHVVFVADRKDEKVLIYKGVTTPNVEQVSAAADKTSATISARVDPIGAGNITGCELEYGSNPEAYGAKAPCSPDPAGSPFGGPENVSVALSGLGKETTYHYRFVVTNGNGSTKDVDRTFTTHNVADVETEGTSGVTKTDATLHGSFTGDGNPTNFWFEWTVIKSPSEPEYEHKTSVQSTTTAGRIEASAEVIGELTPYLPQDGPYHYRLVAENSLGDITKGPDRTFHSSPPDPPTVEETSAGEITDTGAKLSGLVNPQGGPTVYAFEWGTSPAFGSSSVITGPIGEDSLPHQVEQTISGLDAGTTYHFRIVAINFGGTTYGPTKTFTTAGTSGAAAGGQGGNGVPVPAPIPAPPREERKVRHCKKGFVKRHGKCVKRKHHRHHHHRRGSKRG